MRRWQVASIWALFLVLSVAYVVGLQRLKHQQSEIAADRNRQIVSLRETAVRSCHSRHLLAVVIATALRDSRRQSLRQPAGSLDGLGRLLRQGVREDEKLLALVRRADCLALSLPSPPPKAR